MENPKEEEDEALERITPHAVLEFMKLDGTFDALRTTIAQQLEASVRFLFVFLR